MFPNGLEHGKETMSHVLNSIAHDDREQDADGARK
jgi:hypothetical protein